MLRASSLTFCFFFLFASVSLHQATNSTTSSDNSYVAQQNAAILAARSQANCTICHMQFSNRANARRHERNIHGVRISSQGATPIAPQGDRVENGVGAAAAKPTVKRPFEPAPAFDYAQPEQYRSLLTEPRLNFIRRHIEFLEQYQTMTCKCCDKQFPTYKFFMAHMRKKYDTLSRNLCFKCLTQFQTKPQFIAHLKKRNCLNLYRVFLADDTISKEPLPSAQIRPGSKEIIANKTYGCRLCAHTFRLKNDFRAHVTEAHGDAQRRELAGAASCGFCSLEFEDANERRRHFNNVECMVFLVCGTCDEKFDTHPAYITHVYADHIHAGHEAAAAAAAAGDQLDDDATAGLMADELSQPQSKARSPQNCTVCGKQYNNYYNVLRHMESKHPDQVPTTYRCDRCEIGYPRQVELRDHMLRVHNERVKFDTIKSKREQHVCRQCSEAFEQQDGWLAHQMDQHAKYSCSKCEEEATDREAFLGHLATHSESKSFKCPLCQHSFSSERGFETHLSVVHNMTRDEIPDDADDGDGDGDGDGEGQLPVECAVEINGDDDDDDADEDDDGHDMDDDDFNDTDNNDGNDADIDETMEHPSAKRMKMDAAMSMGAQSTPNDSLLSNTCRICKEIFVDRGTLMLHMRNSHSSIRPMPALTASPNVTPIQVHNVNNRLRCRICQKRIHTKNGYKRHMLQVHNVKDCVFIKCTLCPSEFSNDKGLKVHMFRTHNITVQQMQADESLVPIPKQESTSPTPTPVVQRGEPKSIFECNICHTVYRSREHLRSHKSVVHKITDG